MNKAFKRYGKKRYMGTPLAIMVYLRRSAFQSCHYVVDRKDDYHLVA